jgi:anti-sigma factor RsiW
MVCTHLDELIEPIAAGDMVPDSDTRAHLASCAACAHALELARQIDGVLAAQPVPDVGPAFTSRLMVRLRRERWRSEQYLDVAFNIAVALAVATTVGGLVMVLAASGLTTVSPDLTGLFVSGVAEVLSAVTPALPVYGVAAAVFVSGMAIWWWAERGFEI